MRILRRLLYAIIALVVVGLGLLALLIGPTTLRLMDPQLLAGIPAAIVRLARPVAGIAEREAAGGPLRYEERFIPGAEGDPPVRIIIVEPRDAAPGRPGLLDIHGGGYVYGAPEQSLPALLDELVLRFGITAVSVDYRLAPGTRWPGSLHDNYAALKWFHAHAAEMGVDPHRIGVIGLSAGGGHAAALSLHARDLGEVPIRFQALLCPMLDDRTGSTIDPGEALGRFLWTREDNRKGWTALLGVPAGSDAVPAGAVPMRATDLSRLPPTYIAVGSLDLFAPENAEYARRLEAAGVPTELRQFAGGFHGFEILIPWAPLSQQARNALHDFMARQFGLGRPQP
ncbi:MAG TPA: alpha/beta hydrolase [Fontimonas sp.]